MSDFDNIATQIDAINRRLQANTHSPMNHGSLEESDSVTVTKNAWIATAVDLARLSEWVKGLSQAYKVVSDTAP